MDDRTLPVVEEIEVSNRIVSIDWAPDGQRLVIATGDGLISIVDRLGHRLWSYQVTPSLSFNHFAKWSPTGKNISFSSGSSRGVFSANTGEMLWSKDENSGWRHSFYPSGEYLAYSLLPTNGLGIELALTGSSEPSPSDLGRIGCPTWSPNGETLAFEVSQGTITLIDWGSRSQIASVKVSAGWLWDLAWSPDSAKLACGAFDSGGSISIVDRGSQEITFQLATQSPPPFNLDWSRRGALLAIGSQDRGLATIFRADSFEFVATYEFPGGTILNTAVAFTHSGHFLAVGSGKRLQILDASSILKETTSGVIPAVLHEFVVQQASTLSPRPARLRSPGENRLSRQPGSHLDRLPRLFSTLQRLDLTPPLSLLQQLDDLVAGRAQDSAVNDLTDHPGVRRLRALQWPSKARAGLIALLLRDLPLGEWRPPSGTDSQTLRAAMEDALRDESIEPRPEPFPGVLLRQAADAIDDRLLMLLKMAGPEAVIEDPGLPLRMLRKTTSLPPIATVQQTLLVADESPRSSGRAQSRLPSAGIDGIGRRGQPSALLPSQLALPPDVLAMRHLRGDLLFRSHAGGEPLQLRPTVIVLDISPPTFGAVERILRPAAFLVAQTLLEAGRPALLVTMGGRSRFHVLDRRSQLLACWTERSLEPVRPSEALRAAEALRGTLRGGPAEPIVLFLSHVSITMEIAHDLSEIRALLVRFPDKTALHSLHQDFARLAAVDAKGQEDLSETLQELLV